MLILAGPNGAGKSTFFNALLATSGFPILNPDVIEENLPEASARTMTASRIAVQQRRVCLAARQSFAVETTLSGAASRIHRMLADARSAGFTCYAIYIGLDSSGLSALRVIERMQRGGHGVPLERIATRYARSLENLRDCAAKFDALLILDNSFTNQMYRPAALFRSARLVWRDPTPRPWLTV